MVVSFRSSGPGPHQGRHRPPGTPSDADPATAAPSLHLRRILVSADASGAYAHGPLHSSRPCGCARRPEAGLRCRRPASAQPLVAGVPEPVALRDVPPRCAGGQRSAVTFITCPLLRLRSLRRFSCGSRPWIRAQVPSMSQAGESSSSLNAFSHQDLPLVGGCEGHRCSLARCASGRSPAD
jgi:hypothetical protein